MRKRMIVIAGVIVGIVLAAAATASAQEQCLFVPAAGRTLDSPAGYWETGLDLANLGALPLAVRVDLLDRGVPNADPVSRILDEPLAPGSSFRLDDVVNWVLDRQWRPWYGGLAVCADGAGLQAEAQVRFVRDGDSYGAGISAASMGEAIVPGAVGHLLGLREDETFRSNLDLLNLADEAVAVTIRVVLEDGEPAYFMVRELPARGQVQLYRLLLGVPGSELQAARLELTTTGPVLAVVSRVDRRTNDPMIIPARVVNGG